MRSISEAARPAANEGARAPARLPGRTLSSTATQAEDVLKAFNSWAFKREQPDTAELLRDRVEQALHARRPLPFVAYWGRGERTRVAAPERECLAFLEKMAGRIAAAFAPGAEITLIQTDTHARLNGHCPLGTEAYFAEVSEEAGRRGFATRRLSALLGGLEPDRQEPAPCKTLLAALTAAACKHYRGADDPAAAAQRYYESNMVERRGVQRAFPAAVFLTFNGGDMRALFPQDMPIFYMYSVRRGVAAKPWFMADG